MPRTAHYLEQIQQLNIDGIRRSLAYMPDCPYKQLSQWLLLHRQDDWLQLIGISSLTRLTFQSLYGIVPEAALDRLLPYAVPMNISQMYEVVSDNLALGLGDASPLDNQAKSRRKVLRVFNDAVILGILHVNGTSQSATRLLTSFESLMRPISLFEQSLSADKHRQLIRAFLDEHPHIPPEALEYAVHPNLIVNLETCLEVIRTLDGYATKSIVNEGLLRRYHAVNCLLEADDLSQTTLLEVSTDAIMVIPTLAYYIAVIAESVYPMKRYHATLMSGSLMPILETAALLVRLLNDMGTTLLQQSVGENCRLIEQLRAYQQRHQFDSFNELLLSAATLHSGVLNRLQKDCRFGEFNVGLHQARRMTTVEDALSTFEQQVFTLATLYQTERERLERDLRSLTFQLQDPTIARLIARFVKFHEQTYSHTFTDPLGEYAV
ncbi:MAG: hypothetical protein MUF87_07655 [Anaerolineae bacterium]|jgi:hypothetical protein|nr:hypothetical protein [Anaerolineae bacterium]